MQMYADDLDSEDIWQDVCDSVNLHYVSWVLYLHICVQSCLWLISVEIGCLEVLLFLHSNESGEADIA